jgi:hypothetical protein
MLLLMSKSNMFTDTLAALTARARSLGLTDTQWAERAAVRKETLSRLRRRSTCDFETLQSLAASIGARVGLLEERQAGTADGLFPVEVDRSYEQRLVDLAASGSLDVTRWAAMGTRFFMAGLAVMLASTPSPDRPGLLALAEALHPGSTEPVVFSRWLERSPVRPSRFLPMVDVHRAHAA